MTSKTSSVFDWAAKELEPAVVRSLLTAYGEDVGDSAEIGELRALSPDELTATATLHFGRPPQKAAMRGQNVVDFLRNAWLPRQSAAAVDSVVRLLSVGLQRTAPEAKHARLTYLAGLNRTETLAMALRGAFIARYKVKQPARRQAVSVSGQRASGAITFRGVGAESLELYPHQERAQACMTAWERKKPTNGLIVLPTGAGKTITAISWLLEWLAKSGDRRVLWLAHQRELADQAARAFVASATAQPSQFECRMRLIHGAGSAASTLIEPELRIAVATMQTVRPNGDRKKVAALRRFAAGPTIVVVDEAHRAASKTYGQLLDVLQAQPSVRVLGLTATPTPSGAVATRRLRERFPHTLISVDPAELVQQGILAQPIFHKVDTHVSIEMSPEDVRKALSIDVPESVLKQLAGPLRNQLILDTWLRQRDTWGKTLVFATSIRHADELARAFVECGVDAKAVHSRSMQLPSDTLDWFRSASGQPVLISVGMLTEGVDIPDAQTAFLARPTTSAILMRQMIGRVLRGPRANGTPVAHLVTLHDDWVNFTGVIEPIDLKNLPEAFQKDPRHGPHGALKLVTLEGQAIPPGVLAQIQRLYADHAAIASQGAYVSAAVLVGYYDLTETRIPVFAHQRDSFTELIDALLAGISLAGRPALSYFADDPLPYPTERSLVELTRELRDTGDLPQFTPCQVLLTPDATAHRLRNVRSLTEEQRLEILREGWEGGGNLAYESFGHWHEAVDGRLRELMRRTSGEATVSDPENIVEPVKARIVARDLRPLFQETVSRAHNLLDSSDTRARLGRLPALRWSKRPLQTVHAHWTLKKSGPMITVSTSLQVARKHVSDELLRYLLWHELLHHVLPGHGHDAEFRHLEARWPESLDLDRELDTLHERLG